MKLPFNYTPLHLAPYNSRTSYNEFTTGLVSKNYVLVAFKSGEALQASELNEIQDNFYKHTTLSNLLFKNWLFIGADGFTSGDPTLPVYGPSWVGAVPLSPVDNVIIIENDEITLKVGWYLVDDKSGIKFWIYNNTDKIITSPTVVDSFIGFTISSSYINTTTDDGLNDNSGGSSSTIPGADRYQLNITGTFVQQTEETDWLITDKRPIMKVFADNKYRYLNNLQIGTG